MHLQNLVKMVVLLFCLQSCGQKNTSVENIEYSKGPLDKQITYVLQLNMKLPYELYINDIKASYDYTGTNVGVDMNAYLLKNGKCKIKIKIYPAFKAGKTEIPLDDLENSTILFGKYIMDKEKNDIHSYNINDFTKLDYNLPDKPVTSFEQEWEVNITELPYELEGWSKGQDLRKWNQKELEKKVVDFHENIWKILNNGDSERWVKLTSNRFDDLKVYDYLCDYEKELNEIKKDVEKYAKNTMIPLEDYEMKLYANGKLVTLERKSHTREFNHQSPLDIKGWGGLVSKGKISGAADYRILLYLPQDSDEFVIIRK